MARPVETFVFVLSEMVCVGGVPQAENSLRECLPLLIQPAVYIQGLLYDPQCIGPWGDQ